MLFKKLSEKIVTVLPFANDALEAADDLVKISLSLLFLCHGLVSCGEVLEGLLERFINPSQSLIESSGLHWFCKCSSVMAVKKSPAP